MEKMRDTAQGRSDGRHEREEGSWSWCGDITASQDRGSKDKYKNARKEKKSQILIQPLSEDVEGRIKGPAAEWKRRSREKAALDIKQCRTDLGQRMYDKDKS
jgi:hypothetical protein